jgi:hypothetical protein
VCVCLCVCVVHYFPGLSGWLLRKIPVELRHVQFTILVLVVYSWVVQGSHVFLESKLFSLTKSTGNPHPVLGILFWVDCGANPKYICRQRKFIFCNVILLVYQVPATQIYWHATRIMYVASAARATFCDCTARVKFCECTARATFCECAARVRYCACIAHLCVQITRYILCVHITRYIWCVLSTHYIQGVHRSC